jgi:hypothetical protein
MRRTTLATPYRLFAVCRSFDGFWRSFSWPGKRQNFLRPIAALTCKRRLETHERYRRSTMLLMTPNQQHLFSTLINTALFTSRSVTPFCVPRDPRLLRPDIRAISKQSTLPTEGYLRASAICCIIPLLTVRTFGGFLPVLRRSGAARP